MACRAQSIRPLKVRFPCISCKPGKSYQDNVECSQISSIFPSQGPQKKTAALAQEEIVCSRGGPIVSQPQPGQVNVAFISKSRAKP